LGAAAIVKVGVHGLRGLVARRAPQHPPDALCASGQIGDLTAA
jgi:hypothetical protein